MGFFLADCMSSLEQIRQPAAGSLVEQHAPFCHRRDEWEESSITAFVKALSQGDEQLITALLKLGMEHWVNLAALLRYRLRFGDWTLDFHCVIATAVKFSVFWNRGCTWKNKLTKCATYNEVFKFYWLLLSCVAAYSSVRQRVPPHCAGAREGEGK